MSTFSRRMALKLIALGTATIGAVKNTMAADVDLKELESSVVGQWSKTHNRVFLGGEFWANPMEDWRITDGAAECIKASGGRNIQLITHQLTDLEEAFVMAVDVEQVEVKKEDGGAGFRIGIRSDLNEYRSNSFAGGGINAGLQAGKLVLGSQKKPLKEKHTGGKLVLAGHPNGKRYNLSLSLFDDRGQLIESLNYSTKPDEILGNVAVMNNFGLPAKRWGGARYRFRNWSVSGEAFTLTPSRKFGPILWTMYSLSDSRTDEGFVFKLSALTGPLGEEDQPAVELLIEQAGQWISLGTADLDTDAWTATFRIPNWDESKSVRYKVVYQEQHNDGTSTTDEWTGSVKANPVGRPLELGALTCQKDYGFPYEPVANNLIKLDPDLLYFSGDQLYEDHGGFGLIRDPAEPAILNYLRKYYMFGWAFRQAMKDRPTLCLPDDHDVFQGNIWGEGGAPMKDLSAGASSKGGYREPARMVNVVHRTCTAHHPDFFDPKPSQQEISVYYGDMVYGNVSFAILGDRQWKSGPERVETGSGRADHVKDPNFDSAALDKPGLVLLGERQEKFLEHWVNDWRGHEMKVLLSQTVFAGVATHHGGYDGYLKCDLDSGGWPQTPRNNVIKILRKGMPLHINGDQHLTTLSQYGVDKQREGSWSFCTPAIAAGYPRWWRPDELSMPHTNRPKHGLPNTGEYLDGFGNKVYVYAVGNPEVGTEKNRYDLAHQKGSGFGLVLIDTRTKTYTLNAFRFLVDPTDGKATNQFPGWPVVIHQQENAGNNLLG